MARKEEELRQGWKALENARLSAVHEAAAEAIASQEVIQEAAEAAEREAKEAATRATIEEAARRAEEAKAAFQKAYDDQQAKLAEDRDATEITKQAAVRALGPQPRCAHCKRTGHLVAECWDPHTRCGDCWCNVSLKHKSYHPLKRCRASRNYDPTYGRLEHMNAQATRFGEPLFKGTNAAREQLAKEGRCFACGSLDHAYRQCPSRKKGQGWLAHTAFTSALGSPLEEGNTWTLHKNKKAGAPPHEAVDTRGPHEFKEAGTSSAQMSIDDQDPEYIGATTALSNHKGGAGAY